MSKIEFSEEQIKVLGRFRAAVEISIDLLQLRSWKIYVQLKELKNADGTLRDNWAEECSDTQGRIASITLNPARCLDSDLDVCRVAVHECLEVMLSDISCMAASSCSRGFVETELHRVIRVLEHLLTPMVAARMEQSEQPGQPRSTPEVISMYLRAQSTPADAFTVGSPDFRSPMADLVKALRDDGACATDTIG